jgi:SAM-dependent methyltransferase
MLLAKRLLYRHWQSFHPIRRLELAVLRRYLGPIGRERILDIGSGKGAFCGVLRRLGARVTGVDPSLRATRTARRYVHDRIGFVAGRGEELAFASQSFDKAVSVCVLEHTEDDRRVLSEVNRVLRDGGTFALSVDSLDSRHISAAFRDRHVRLHRCRHLYDEAGLREMLDAAGFATLETEYLFDSTASAAVLRFGSWFRYRGIFILLFPILYPVLWLDHRSRRSKNGGMILAARARKVRNVPSPRPSPQRGSGEESRGRPRPPHAAATD